MANCSRCSKILSWPPLAHDSNVTREVTDFCDCLVEENFFTQHVVEWTRQDAILDLVITDEPAMIHDVVSLGTFPGSDHNALLWTLEVKTVCNESHRQMFDYPNLTWKAKRANYIQYTGKNSSAIQMPTRIGWLLKRLWSIYR